MTQQMKSGERQLRAFEASLTKILGADNFPREALGDLSVLLDTLRRAVNLLMGLMEFRRNFERQPAAKLHELAIVLDDLRPILKALRPTLKEMTKTAYSICEKSSNEKQLKQAKRLLKKIKSLRFGQDDHNIGTQTFR